MVLLKNESAFIISFLVDELAQHDAAFCSGAGSIIFLLAQQLADFSAESVAKAMCSFLMVETNKPVIIADNTAVTGL